MGILYLTEPGVFVRKETGCIQISKDKIELLRKPLGQISALVVYPGVQISSNLVNYCLASDISITYISGTGRCLGRSQSISSLNIVRQKQQFIRADDGQFCLSIARKLIEAKIRNSRTVILEFARYRSAAIDFETDALSDCIKQINTAGTLERIMGIEGIAAKSYFRALSRLVHPEFRFNGRSRNPPRDPFNAMLSYGYMLLFNDILTILQIHGLHAYVGFLHQLRNGHPALVSDLMEEWRPILVDSFCMHLANRRTFKSTEFTSGNGGVYLAKDQAKIYLERYEERIKKIHLTDEQKVEFNYRAQLENQVLMLVKAIEENDPSIYVPFLIH